MTLRNNLLVPLQLLALLAAGVDSAVAACSNTAVSRLTGVPSSVRIYDPYGTYAPSVSFTINGVSCVVDSIEDQSGSGTGGLHNAELALVLFGAKIEGRSADVNLYSSGRIDSVAYPFP